MHAPWAGRASSTRHSRSDTHSSGSWPRGGDGGRRLERPSLCARQETRAAEQSFSWVGQTARVDISARVDYAVRAMLILAEADAEGSGPISIDILSTRQELPRKFLEAIFADLRRGSLVLSRRGARGGYVLGRPRGEISVGDIFRAVDGPLAEVRGLRPHETEYQGVATHLPSLWVAVRVSLREVLDETSIEDLRTGDLPDRVRQLLTAPDAWQNR